MRLVKFIENFEKSITRKIFWGIILIFLAAIAFYNFFHEKKLEITYEIISESNVLDIHKPLKDLTIFFKDENIQKKNLNLKVYTIRVYNTGELNIRQDDFDKNLPWGLEVKQGKIINKARLINTNSEYLMSNLEPTVLDTNKLEFKKIIFERNKFFIVELLVLHSKVQLPSILPIGKIAGVEENEPLKSFVASKEKSFIETFFAGGIILNLIRAIFFSFCVFISLFCLSVSLEKIDSLGNEYTK